MTDQKPNRLSRKVGQIGLAIVAALAVVIGLASPAYANFPHFKTVSVSLADTSLASVRTAASSASSSAQLPDLLFSWTEVGRRQPRRRLQPQHGRDRHVRLCKRRWEAPVGLEQDHDHRSRSQTSVQLAADKNGKITGSAILDTGAVSLGGFSCPQRTDAGRPLRDLHAQYDHGHDERCDSHG